MNQTLQHMSRTMRKLAFAYEKTKGKISCRVPAQLNQHLCFPYTDKKSLNPLNLKFQASNHLLWLYSLVCVAPGREPRRQCLFCGSYALLLQDPLAAEYSFIDDPVTIPATYDQKVACYSRGTT